MNKSNICNACPRNCKVDREQNTGYCKSSQKIKISRASRHLWEEPCISGTKGSGTVFFSGCNLRCVYCQNYEISNGNIGNKYDDKEVQDLFLRMADSDIHNINLVTPTHYLPRLSDIIAPIKSKIKKPIVCNCSGYENPGFIKESKGIIDIFLTDFKYKSKELSKRYSDCGDYFDVAIQALEGMIEVAGRPQLDSGLMKAGVIVRHMILPSHKNDSIEILRELYDRFGNDKFLLSLMSQFTPTPRCSDYPEINRNLTSLEYKRVEEVYRELGFDGYVQDRLSIGEKYIPDFYDKGEFLIF